MSGFRWPVVETRYDSARQKWKCAEEVLESQILRALQNSNERLEKIEERLGDES